MPRSAFRTLPLPDPQIFYFMVDVTAFTAGLAARIPSVDCDQFLSVPVRLVLQLSADLSP